MSRQDGFGLGCCSCLTERGAEGWGVRGITSSAGGSAITVKL